MNRGQNLVTVYGKQKRQAPTSLRTVNMETGRFDPSMRSNLVVPPLDVAQQFHLQQQQFAGPPQKQQFPGPPQQQQQFPVPPQQQQQFPVPPQQQQQFPVPPQQQQQFPGPPHQQFQGPPQQQQFQRPPQQQQQFQGPPQQPFPGPPHRQQFPQGPPLPVPHPFLQQQGGPPPPHQFAEPPRQFPPPPQQQEPRHGVPAPGRFVEAPPPFPSPEVLQQPPGQQCPHGVGGGGFNSAPPPPQQQAFAPLSAPEPPPQAAQERSEGPAQPPPPSEGATPPQQKGAGQTKSPEGLLRGCAVPKASVNQKAVTLYPHTVRAFLNGGGLTKRTGYQWNRVTVHNFPPDEVMTVMVALNQFYYPKTVATYMHWVEENRLNFLMSEVDSKKLMHGGLKLPVSPGCDSILLTMTPGYSNVQINHLVRTLLGKRFDETRRHLDLSYVTFEPEVRKIFYDLDSHPCGWQSLIEEGAKMVKELVTLSLAKNALRCHILEKVLGVVKTFQSLCVLDLSDNEIQALPVKKLQIHNVTEVSLTGNPLCAKYGDVDSYVSDLKTIFPSLTKVDETFVHRGLPPWRRTLVASEDLRVLADQFLEHFFRLYDGNRKQLRGLYHEDAVFSLSSAFLPGQSTSSSARLSAYAVESRNLLKLSDLSKAGQQLFAGAEAVLGAVARLPQSRHDPGSFTVDCPRRDLLTVTGVFAEPPKTAALRYFVRTFVLVRVGAAEFQVANDVLFVTNASTRQAKEAFRHRRPPLARPPPPGAPPPPQLSDCDKLQMAKILAQLTEMNEPWSYKCLDESQWDIKEALLVFSELLKLDRIPEAAFRKPEEPRPHPALEAARA